MDLFRTKNITHLKDEAKKTTLKRTLGTWDVALMGVGVIIGAGIFVLTGKAAATDAGPAIMLSFLVSSIACVFISLAYCELSSSVPIAGSAYSYTYVGLGEFFAWLVGWSLILEYSVGASAVAGGWSHYLVGLLKTGGVELPKMITSVPADGGLVDLPAMLIVLFITFLLVRGVKESANVNRMLVGVKLLVIFIFLLVAGPSVAPENWSPFFPFASVHSDSLFWGAFGSVAAGSAAIFFSYLGVDSLATAAEETRNPQRDMPRGIILSLVICTILYIAVAAVMTGSVSYAELNSSEPVAYVLRKLGYNFGSAIVGVGAVAGLSTVCLVMIYAQTRAFFAMSRDGLIPQSLCEVHPKYGTPYKVTLIVGCVVTLIAGFAPIGVVAEACSIGTLFAFIMAMVSVIVMRTTRPNMERPFRCPAIYITVPLGIACCVFIMYGQKWFTWKLFLSWIAFGIVIYFIYGYKNSLLNKQARTAPAPAE